MNLWIDAQLSPALAPWIKAQFDIDAKSVAELGFRDAKDEMIFAAARAAEAVVMTKDKDFSLLLHSKGSPPQILLVTIGNTSTARMKQILLRVMPAAIKLLKSGEPLVEIAESC